MQLMLASTQRAAQRRGISEGGPARRRWRGSKRGPKPGTGVGAEGSRGRSSPPGPSRPLRARRGGRRSGAGTTTGRDQAREEELWLGGRRGLRGAGSRLGVGVGRWGRESPPRWHPAPRPHLAGFFPGRGAPAAPPRPPRVSPTRSGRPSPPVPAGPRLRPAPPRPEEREQGRGPRDPSAPGAATEGRTCAGGGRSLSASAATAWKARPLLFRISSVPGRK